MTEPDLTASPDVLAGASLPLLRVLAAVAEASLDASAPELTLQQFRALTILHEEGPQNSTPLAAALGIAPSTLTRLADRLVRDGLIRREADPADRRAVILSETSRGARIWERVRTWRLRELTRRYADVAPPERSDLLRALERCHRILSAGEST
jgi:DNA-binding MarR family transcriptional regulator